MLLHPSYFSAFGVHHNAQSYLSSINRDFDYFHSPAAAVVLLC